jgi:hypothetical protein
MEQREEKKIIKSVNKYKLPQKGRSEMAMGSM